MSGIVFWVSIYIVGLIGHHLSFFVTGFIRPRGLWLLVPFRVSGWRSSLAPDKVYPIRWAFSLKGMGKHNDL